MPSPDPWRLGVTAGWRFRPLGNQRGQALVEMGLVVVLLVTLSMGILEFGRAWMVANMITQAAREGARAAAVVPSAQRTGGIINSTSSIETLVRNEIRGVLDAATTNSLSVAVTQPTSGGIPLATVTVSGTVPYIFNLIGTGFAVNRSVSFRDEGR